jgi:BirA family biotin operon repressor/biotin-[acetyl-CoA-carboxylase] ligase
VIRPLRPRHVPAGLVGPLVHLDVTGSTNEDARRLALAGAPDGTVVVAEEQTAGRGRQGRSWTAPRGSALTLSLIRRLESLPAAAIDLLPLATALAICDACEAVAPVDCRIKWPNDIWIDERKLAGVLIESRPQEGWAVIGVGLNVDTSEEQLGRDLRRTAISLRIASGVPMDRDRALAALLEALAVSWHALAWEPATVLHAYRQRDLLKGRRIAWAPSGSRLRGEAQGIDDAGNLIVSTDEGERLALNAGEVHLEVD